MMIEATRQNLVVEDHGSGFHAVFAFELPDNAAVVLVQAIDITVGGRKIDAIVAKRRLTRPGCSAPQIFMELAGDETRFELPDNFQATIFPWTGSVEVSFRVPQPHRN